MYSLQKYDEGVKNLNITKVSLNIESLFKYKLGVFLYKCISF